MTTRCKATALWMALLIPGTTLAHAPIEGIGNFYNGLLHPVLVPAHLLLLVAIGLFIGQQRSKNVEAALGSFALATIVGLILAWFSIGAEAESIVLVLSTTIGLVIAIKPEIKRLVAAIRDFVETTEPLPGGMAPFREVLLDA